MLKRIGAYIGLALGVFGAGSIGGAAAQTATPIQHVVVIFGENNSFDHYFGTYPVALNPPGETVFTALPSTPGVNGIGPASSDLQALNPNYFNGSHAPPFRLDPITNPITCDNDNAYDAEQEAYDKGLGDQFPTATSAQAPAVQTGAATPSGSIACDPNEAMGYYDGNTVTALWNYAQHYAMSDNFYDTEFGVTVEGHLNLISGQTHTTGATTGVITGVVANGSVIANIDPPAAQDICTKSPTVKMTSRNIGDLLNAKGVTWGWFYGDFASGATPNPCTSANNPNYNPHYMPFQYYASTANPQHLAPLTISAVGTSDGVANHQYDLNVFNQALAAGNLPAVTLIKATQSETGHPTKSGPLLEQTFLVNTINALMQSPDWPTMAIFITYDDSDGWYDHVMPPIVNESNDTLDHICNGPVAPGAFLDRCGYGTRLPLLVLSPFAKQNYVDHSVNDLTSILAFIETNWSLGFIDATTPSTPGAGSFDRLAGSLPTLFNFTAAPNLKKLTLNPNTGVVVSYQ
jgi:phospholipase C